MQCNYGEYGEIISNNPVDEQIELISTKCQACSHNCLTCINSLQIGCTSCLLGFELKTSDSTTGVCEAIQMSSNNISNKTLVVTGERAQGNDLNNLKFADLISALKHAYKLHAIQNLKTVTILVSESAEHFVIASDYSNSYPLIEEQSLLNGSYSLFIMPESCSTYSNIKECPRKVRVNNKIGSNLKMFIPNQGSLFFGNIEFDSIDSVLPYDSACLDELRNCCTIDYQSTLFNCTNSNGDQLKPIFNKFNHCYSKPMVGGIFQFLNSGADKYNSPQIIIHNCEFRNFYYEMNSLIGLPLNNEALQVTLEKNLFLGFSSCGSLLSNSLDFSSFDSSNSVLKQEEFMHYTQDYLAYNYAYIKKTYSQNNLSSANQTFVIKDNFFGNFNILKKRNTDLVHQRKEQGVAMAQNIARRNLGMVIEIFGGTNLTIDIINNTFENITQHFGRWNGLQYDHCSKILSDFQTSQNTSENAYYQLNHVISIYNIKNSRIIIGSNNFKNLSTSGPIIFMQETENTTSSKFMVIQNEFRQIHGYVNSNAIQIQRSAQSNSYSFGGNIVISENTFTEIAGCPTVLASAILVGITNVQSQSPSSFSLNIPDELPSTTYDTSQEQEEEEHLIWHSDYGHIQLKQNTLILESNTFINVSMGVSREIDNKYLAKGGLIKIVNIQRAQISHSSFQNIGAYTVEHSRELLSSIFGINKELISSNQKGELFGEENEQFWELQSDIHESPFMNTYLSTSLICGHAMKSLTLGPGNYFDNIWLIDRHKSFDRDQTQGVLLYLESFNGELTIGGDQGDTVITSITGLINPFTINRFDFWDPQLFPYPNVIQNGFPSNQIIYGAASILFNIHNDSNQFENVVVHNLQLSNIYHRAINKSNLSVPSIISVKGSAQNPKISANMTISGIQIVNSSFELSSGFFQLEAQTLKLENIELKNIGNWNFLNDSKWQNWNVYSQWSYDTNSSIFMVQAMHSLEDFKILNTSFIDINANQGALPIISINAAKQPNASPTLTFDGIIIKNCRSQTKEALPSSILFQILILDESDLQYDIKIWSLKIEESQSQYGIFNIEGGSVKSIEISGSEFKRMHGSLASILYLQDQPATSILFSKCLFVGNNLIFGDSDLSTITDTNKGKAFDQLSLFNFKNVKNVTFTECIGRNNHFAGNGSFLQLSHFSEATIVGSQFFELSSYKGGVLFIYDWSKISISECKFKQNKAIDGGVVVVSESSSIVIYSSQFYFNNAKYNGVFKITEDSSVSIDLSDFYENKVIYRNSIGQISQVSRLGLIQNSSFTKNEVDFYLNDQNQQGGGIEIYQSQTAMKIYNSKFIDNLSARGTSCLSLKSAINTVIYESTFISTYTMSIFNDRSTDLVGGFINMQSTSSLGLFGCLFQGGIADIGGAIYSIGTNYITISGTNFTNNSARFDGGAIYALMFSQISILQSCKFTNNLVYNSNKGDAISLKGRQRERIYISNDVQFSSNFSSSYIYADTIWFVLISGVLFENTNHNFTSEYFVNGGIYLRDVLAANIQNCTFYNMYGEYELGGSAIILEQTSHPGFEINQLMVQIYRNHFQNCYSKTKGGAISIINYDLAFLYDNVFINNSARVAGGALYYSCAELYSCYMKIQKATFRDNYAHIEGGAIKWTTKEPEFIDIQFINNSAAIYGDNIASVARVLVRITEEELGKKHYNSSGTIKVAQDSNIPEFQSGGTISLYFGIIDKYGTYVATDSDSKLILKLQSLAPNPQFLSVIESQTELNSVNGTYSIKNLIFVCQPNTTQILTLNTLGIDSSVYDNTIITDWASPLNNQPIQPSLIANASSTFPLTISVQSCHLGSQLLSNGRCQQCSWGTYLFDVYSEPFICKQCQTQFSECLGGFEVYPLPGYWRSSNISEQFYACLYSDACLGKNNDTQAYQGQCDRGYQGFLCADCELNYSKNPTLNRCSKCPKNGINVLILLAMFLVLAIIIIILVNSNKINSKNEKNYLPVLFRILLNHFQILYLTASFDLEWPEELLNFYKSIQPISDAQSQIFSIDCFLYHSVQSTQFAIHRLVVIKSFFVMIFPIFLVVICMSAQSIWVMCTQKQTPTIQVNMEAEQTERVRHEIEENSLTQLRENDEETIEIHQLPDKKEGTNLVSTLIVILFLIHPSITREMFAIFNCKTIDGVNRLYYDLETVCYGDEHITIVKWVASPSLIFYSLGIPTLGLYILMKNRKNLEKYSVKRAYGFLYNGYKKGRSFLSSFRYFLFKGAKSYKLCSLCCFQPYQFQCLSSLLLIVRDI
ncbi:hypothetical protein FGO68_gene3741 [Halteria grandinella]|uniref:Uncharacterized protein n=1 Tax=Halteria grandinella TaxID=5974 RepID=A0A8J8SYH3_HALGN|nr:hypothetical protein FGO68_gene3741 [Halteria grandinella]